MRTTARLQKVIHAASPVRYAVTSFQIGPKPCRSGLEDVLIRESPLPLLEGTIDGLSKAGKKRPRRTITLFEPSF